MNQIYEVSSCGNKDPSEQPYGMIRTFYIAAEEVEWDYAPNKNWEFEKQHLDAGRERYHAGEAAESLGWGRTCSRGCWSNVEPKKVLVLSAQSWQTEVLLMSTEAEGGCHLHPGKGAEGILRAFRLRALSSRWLVPRVAVRPTNVALSEPGVEGFRGRGPSPGGLCKIKKGAEGSGDGGRSLVRRGAAGAAGEGLRLGHFLALPWSGGNQGVSRRHWQRSPSWDRKSRSLW